MNEEEKTMTPVEETTPETQTTVLPAEVEELEEMPVMIAENIDEMPQEQLAAITTAAPVEGVVAPAETPVEQPLAPTVEVPVVAQEAQPVAQEAPVVPETTPAVETQPVVEQASAADQVVSIPMDMPDLGNQEATTDEEKVPTFQQFPTQEETHVEETPAEVQTAPEENQAYEAVPQTPTETPTNLTSMYQAKPSSEQVPTFQQMPEPQVEVPPAPIDEDEDHFEEDKPKKKKILPLIIIVIIIIAVIVVGVLGLQSKGIIGSMKTLRPERSSNSNTNIAVLGSASTHNSQLVSTISKKLGTEVAVEELDSCPDKETYNIKYGLHVVEITSNNIKYNINYACTPESTTKYLLASEGDQTVDGAIVVINASGGIDGDITDYLHTLNKIHINKIVVYLIEDGDTAAIEEELKTALDNNGFDSTNTPVVKGTETDEEKIETLMVTVGSWIKKETTYKQPVAIQSHKKITLYSDFFTADEGGLQEALSDKTINNLTFTINNEDYKAKVNPEKDHNSIQPGDKQEVTVELEKEIPVVKGMRVLIKQGDILIGIGVISNIK